MQTRYFTTISILGLLLLIANGSYACYEPPPDTTPPTPNPMTWDIKPYASGTTSVSMKVTLASDPSGGIEYYYHETSGNPGGNHSGWQSSRTYVDSGLDPSRTYSYRGKARDLHGNTTAFSTIESASPGSPGDSDNDNMPDVWEFVNYLDPNDANDADTDLDSDGYKNLCEYLHETDPNNNTSKPDNSSYIMTIYVPANVNTIQRAIWAAISGDTIEVSQGTYYEVVDFNGVSCTLTGADPDNWQVVAGTIIDANDPNGYVITFENSEDANSILTGFTITGGNLGIYCDGSSPVISNCLITDNNSTNGGAGMYDVNSSPAVTNCFFVDNDANYGGGLYDVNSTATFTSCVFAGNTAAEDGGAIYDVNSTLTLINCTFNGNTADCNGGGMYSCGTSEPNVINCIFWGNEADNDGDEILNADSADPNFRFCDIKGSGGSDSWDPNFGSDDGNNIDIDPTFADSDDFAGPDGLFGTFDDGLGLWVNSPCVDAADGNAAPQTDITGIGRVDIPDVNNTGTGDPNYADIGAYESPIVWFVDADAADGNGISWADPFGDLQDALAEANEGDQIWVAEGTYRPTDTSNRSISFELVEEVAIFGGFDGNEVIRSQRDWKGNETILSGDIGEEDDANDNSYHVVVGADGAVLDGFTITGGNANLASGTYFHGGGIYCDEASPTIRNCTFSNNQALQGGGMFNLSSSPALTNCIFWNNVVAGGNNGGGMYNYYSSPILKNCVFSGNIAEAGGGIFNYGSNYDCLPLLINCTFSNNSAGRDGGGMYNFGEDCLPVVINCIFWGNEADGDGNEIFNYYNADPNFSYCDIEGCGGSGSWDPNFGTNGGNNIDSDPLFVMDQVPGVDADGIDNQWRTSDDGLCLYIDTSGTKSPCIDTGSNSPVIENNIVYDIKGDNRIINGTVDRGPYEHYIYGKVEDGLIIYVDVSNDSGVYNGESWATAFKDIYDAIAELEGMEDVNGYEVWVADGEYEPPGYPDPYVYLLIANVPFYGGFHGDPDGENSPAQRDWVTNETFVKVNYVCVYGADGAAFDGFILKGPCATGSVAIYVANPDAYPSPPSYNLPFKIVNCSFTELRTSSTPKIPSDAIHCWGDDDPVREYPILIKNCTFDHDTIADSITFEDARGSLEVVNCTISGEIVLDALGCPGIRILNSSPTISGCTFDNASSGNTAVDGAIALEEGGSPIIEYCTFINNYSYAFACDEGYPEIRYCTFSDNNGIVLSGRNHSISNLNIHDCNFTDNRGAIQLKCSCTISNCTFSNTGEALEGQDFEDLGGANAIYLSRSGTDHTAMAQIVQGCTITYTHCSTGYPWPPVGNGIMVNPENDDDQYQVTISNSTFENNCSCGIMIYYESVDNVTITDCNYVGNDGTVCTFGEP